MHWAVLAIFLFDPLLLIFYLRLCKILSEILGFQIQFHRKQRRGSLIIDGELVGEGRSEGATRSINIAPPFFIGSLTAEMAVNSADNLDVSNQMKMAIY